MNSRLPITLLVILAAGCSKHAEDTAPAATNAAAVQTALPASLPPARPLTSTIVATQGVDETGQPIVQETTIVQMEQPLPTGQLVTSRRFTPTAAQLERLERIKPVQPAPATKTSPARAITRPPPLSTNEIDG
ncbi:hypothetical protein GX586_02990 [bacterium]|nr:hypothetical protein [bacterium]